MKDSTSLLTQTILTSTLALISLVGFAVLLEEMQPSTTYESVSIATTTPEIQEPILSPTKTEVIAENIVVPPASDQEKKTIAIEETLPETQQVTQPQSAPSSPVTFYSTPPISLDVINIATLPSVVNILCGSSQGSLISGATGSGIIIDSRGVILTNAHVAQYLLLREHPDVKITCVIRSGAPAKAKYTANILAFPQKWAQKHAKDIFLELATGTGEHDWALLYITGTTDGSEKPTSFPFVEFDTREHVAQASDSVLLASYPAGFLGNIALKNELWPVSTIVSIQKVFTFSRSLVDILALGGNIVAQGGSSGGAVVNQWNKLVGIISTSSLGDTTGERDLRAVTLSHINRSIQEHTGFSLESFLSRSDFESEVTTFKENSVPNLLELYPL
ncbi:MAG: trypsin-like peptidase domain-containing protein [Candidatus Pacebacteria bacterium]|nr:trypsin-like peptidase domain-containing protein [Candidatus Paceibacterota bacterium]